MLPLKRTVHFSSVHLRTDVSVFVLYWYQIGIFICNCICICICMWMQCTMAPLVAPPTHCFLQTGARKHQIQPKPHLVPPSHCHQHPLLLPVCHPLTPIANYFQQKSPPSVRYIVNEQTVSPNPIGKEFLKLPPTSNKNTSLMAMK